LSLGKKSALSRNASVTSEDTEKSGLRSRGEGLGAAVATRLRTEPEQEGDDDVTNGELAASLYTRLDLIRDSWPVTSPISRKTSHSTSKDS
jgi:hypothetical protein